MAGESATILRLLYGIQASLQQSGGVGRSQQQHLDRVVKFAEDNLTRKSGDDQNDESNSLSHIYQKKNYLNVNIQAVGGLVGAAVGMARQFVGAAYGNLQQYGGYSAGGIQARMFERLNDLFRNIRISQATAGTMGEFAVAHTRFKNAIEPFQILGANLMNRAGAAVANKAADVINEVTHPMTPDLLRQVSPRLARRLAIIQNAREQSEKNIRNITAKSDRVAMGGQAARDEEERKKQRAIQMENWKAIRDQAAQAMAENLPQFRRAAELARKRMEARKMGGVGDLSKSLLEFAWPGGTDAPPGMRRRMSPEERIEAGRARVQNQQANREFWRNTRRMERIMKHPGRGGAVPRAVPKPVPFNDPRGGLWEKARWMIRRQQGIDSRKTTAAQQLAKMKQKIEDDKRQAGETVRNRLDDYKKSMDKQARMTEIEDKERIRAEYQRQAEQLVKRQRRLGGRTDVYDSTTAPGRQLISPSFVGNEWWTRRLDKLSAADQQQFAELTRQAKRIADEIEKMRKSLRDEFGNQRPNRVNPLLTGSIAAGILGGLFGGQP